MKSLRRSTGIPLWIMLPFWVAVITLLPMVCFRARADAGGLFACFGSGLAGILAQRVP